MDEKGRSVPPDLIDLTDCQHWLMYRHRPMKLSNLYTCFILRLYCILRGRYKRFLVYFSYLPACIRIQAIFCIAALQLRVASAAAFAAEMPAVMASEPPKNIGCTACEAVNIASVLVFVLPAISATARGHATTDRRAALSAVEANHCLLSLLLVGLRPLALDVACALSAVMAAF